MMTYLFRERISRVVDTFSESSWPDIFLPTRADAEVIFMLVKDDTKNKSLKADSYK